MLYRVIVKETRSLQPMQTYWNEEVLYCGYDREEARRVFHESEPNDSNRSYGNSARETVSVIIKDADTDDFFDDVVEEIEV